MGSRSKGPRYIPHVGYHVPEKSHNGTGFPPPPRLQVVKRSRRFRRICSIKER